jgi:mevalonate kinase
MIKVSVPGKIHLLGEHAVVYGKPALLSAIDLRINLEIENSPVDKISPYFKDKSSALFKIKDTIKKEILQKYPGKKIPNTKIKIDSSLPVGSGLGSSAAISVAMTAAFLSLLKINCDLREIYEIAYKGEKLLHGNPSGADLAAVLYGGYTWFRKEGEDLHLTSPLSFNIHKRLKNFVLIDSGKPVETTQQMVKKVASKYTSNPKKIQIIFDSQEKLAIQMLEVLKKGDEGLLIEIIKKAQKNLLSIGVVSEKADKIISDIEKIGGSAKISGGGGFFQGSGMLLVYHKNITKLKEFATQKNLKLLEINLGVEGLKYE